MGNRASRNIYFLLSGLTGLLLFMATDGCYRLVRLMGAITRTIRREIPKATNITPAHQRHEPIKDWDTTVYWQIEEKVETLFSDYVWIRKRPDLTRLSLAAEGCCNFDIELIAKRTEPAGKKKYKTAHVRYSPICRQIDIATDEESETEERALSLDVAAASSPEMMDMYADIYLRDRFRWIEEQCQSTYANHMATFIIPPELLPEERELWPHIRNLLVSDRYAFPDAAILACDFGIEVQIPAEHVRTALLPADQSMAMSEPEANEETLPQKEDLKEIIPDPAFSLCEGMTIPHPEEPVSLVW